MRPAAYFAGTVIVLGIYLAAAAVFAFTPAWVGIGVLAISAIAAVVLVAGERQESAR